jgi:glutathione S-transferase
MKLYYSPGACSLSPHIVLREAGLPFTLEKVDLDSKTTASGADFYQVNPNGYVPALELDDGEVLTEGPAIVQYLAERVPARELAPPAGSRERVRLQEWLNFISTELHKGFGLLFVPDLPAATQAMVKERLAKRLDVTAARLDGKPFVMGETFTVADAYLFVVLSWGGYVGVDVSRWPTLRALGERVAARPAVRAAMVAEGLIKA